MLKRLLTITLLAFALAFSGSAWPYDAAMAESYAKLFAPVKGAQAARELHVLPPVALVTMVKANEPLVVVDIRTPAETAMYGMNLPGSLKIPTSELFSRENLDKLPVDKPVIVICLSGTRAGAAGTALRHIGFSNVYILKGGFHGLVSYYGSSLANTPLKPADKKK